MKGCQLDHNLFAEPVFISQLGDPGRIRTQIRIAQCQIIILKNGSTDKIIKVQLRHFTLDEQSQLLACDRRQVSTLLGFRKKKFRACSVSPLWVIFETSAPKP